VLSAPEGFLMIAANWSMLREARLLGLFFKIA